MLIHIPSRTRGFNLIEILITIAIVGILISTAIPAYQSSLRKSNRSDAKITLNKLALLQEKHYFRTNQYAADFTQLLISVSEGSTLASDEGHYSIRLSGNDNSWSMTATGRGNQADDHECKSLTLTNLGRKTAFNANSKQSTACW